MPGLVSAYDMDDPPDFVLYGNGLAVVREERDSGALTLVEYRLTPQRVRALFSEAAEFAESLRSPSTWAACDFTRPPAPYRPSRVAVTYMITTATGNEEGVPRPWPLPETEPIQERCVVITGAAAARVPELRRTAP
jgi:hypothetical protein